VRIVYDLLFRTSAETLREVARDPKHHLGAGATNLPLCFQLLGATATPPTEQDGSGANNASDLWLCPKCGGPMMVVEILTAAEIQLRSPPMLTAAA
jgi:hypothetical protein